MRAFEQENHGARASFASRTPRFVLDTRSGGKEDQLVLQPWRADALGTSARATRPGATMFATLQKGVQVIDPDAVNGGRIHRQVSSNVATGCLAGFGNRTASRRVYCKGCTMLH
jgi:hypothetical protein